MTKNERLTRLFNKWCADYRELKIKQLGGSGSNREYFRLTALLPSGEQTSCIGTIGVDTDENKAFVYLARHFSKLSLHVPQVLEVETDYGAYLQTDLGDELLFSLLPPSSNTTIELCEKALKMLTEIQVIGTKGLDYKQCFPCESFNAQSVMWDLNYFKYEFLKFTGMEFSESRLETDFQNLKNRIDEIASTSSTFMVRDFQSRNVMIHDNEPYLIDFQGGRRGPAEYDVASFLWQAKAGFTQEERNRLLDSYIKNMEEVSKRDNYPFDAARFRRQLPLFVLVRILQALGAYGFRGWGEGKGHFLQSMSPALKNLRELFDNQPELAHEFPYLNELASSLFAAPAVSEMLMLNNLPDYNGLTVSVYSFSYKHGMPPDLTGNGGGFAFDCRAIHNPGRYAEYRNFTGRDPEVKQFLTDNGEVFPFLHNAEEMVFNSVERYMRRNFTSLNVGFGCTGGQHRSVFCAEALAHALHARFPEVRVTLRHCRQPQLGIIVLEPESNINQNISEE